MKFYFVDFWCFELVRSCSKSRIRLRSRKTPFVLLFQPKFALFFNGLAFAIDVIQKFRAKRPPSARHPLLSFGPTPWGAFLVELNSFTPHPIRSK
jgi:hypothetical protein